MKNTLKVDFANSRIVMDRTFAVNCENTNSEEYAHLQRVRQDYPNFMVVRKTIKKNPNQERYHGLTYEYMRFYISQKDNAEEMLKKLDELILIGGCHSKGRAYATIKKWFLTQYPEVKEFFVPDDETTKSNEILPFQKEEEVQTAKAS